MYKLPIEIHEEAIFKYEHGLKFLPRYIVDSLKNKDFIDCGAYTGDSALFFEKELEPSRIYSFEPVPDNFKYLLETMQMNNLKKVIPIDKGLGEKTCTVNFYPLSFCSTIAEEGNAQMDLISIDDFVRERKLSVGLIKMDLEGYELPALSGAQDTIKKFKPVLLLSIYHNPEEFFGAKKCVQDLMPSNQFMIRHLADIRPVGEMHLIAW
jgi:FkbM family methyltransferase